ncbi:MAG: putative signal transducing protein [Candidatus Aquicultor sp.]
MDNDIVELYTTMSGPEAAVVRSLLESAGIRFSMVNTSPVLHLGYNVYDTPLATIVFYVHKDDYEHAKELLLAATDTGYESEEH